MIVATELGAANQSSSTKINPLTAKTAREQKVANRVPVSKDDSKDFILI
jgi:hypothetical protein